MRQIVEFDDFHFDPAGPSLTCGSKLVDLAPKALEILSVLVRNAGLVVGKDDLLTLVWPHTVVEEGNLAVYIHSLRRALAAHGSGTCQIQTVPKRGYRFAVPVRPVLPLGDVAPNDTIVLLRVAEHYLQQKTKSGCRRATEIYRKCIKDDPLDMKARAGLADSLLMRFILGDLGHKEGVGGALTVLAKANEIQGDSADVNLSLSRLHYVWDWQWQRSADELQRGIELATDHATRVAAQAWQGVCFARVGDLDLGLRQLRHASAASPLSPDVWFFRTEAHYLARDFAASAAVSTEALQLRPNCWYLHGMLARPLTALREYAAALRHLRLAKLLCPEARFALSGAIACVHAIAGRKDRAARLLTQIAESRVVKVSSDSGVKLEQTAQSVATVNGPAFRRYVHRREEEKIVFALVVAFKMMMFDILSQRAAQRSFSKENELGQAFLPCRAHPSLGKSVQNLDFAAAEPMAVYHWIAGHLEMQCRISYRDHGEDIAGPGGPRSSRQWRYEPSGVSRMVKILEHADGPWFTTMECEAEHHHRCPCADLCDWSRQPGTAPQE
jgi:DNA-binding winged helix-turn-helix (wHTH) protein